MELEIKSSYNPRVRSPEILLSEFFRPIDHSTRSATLPELRFDLRLEPWTRSSWRQSPAGQQPDFENPDKVASVLTQIRSYPPLVSPGEIMTLRRQLAEAEIGRRFLLQGGDCAERFDDCTPSAINQKVSLLLRMGLVLTSGLSRPIIKVGRIAGQYAKPRSFSHESKDGRLVPAFRGDSVHDFETRKADPGRLLQAYHAASLTLNYIRSLVAGGFTEVARAREWHAEAKCSRFENLAASVHNAMELASAFGSKSAAAESHEIFASHEGLLLDFEEAMTRDDPETGVPFNLSAHTLWIGERTRNLGGAHVEYFRGIANPVGVKVGAGASPHEIAELVKILNPNRERGKLILITRLGAKNVDAELPGLIAAVRETRTPVLWCCDPMHGNTVKSMSGLKTRHVDAIVAELKSTVAVHAEHNSRLGGVHLEMTGADVTECTGGGVSPEHLPLRFETYCDPRLNGSQSLNVAFELAQLI